MSVESCGAEVIANRQTAMSGSRILYVSDNPVSVKFSGATFMFRLFEDLRREDLVVYQGMKINIDAELPGIKYYYQLPFMTRLKRTRLTRFHDLLNLGINLVYTSSKLNNIMAEFRPQVIVTVSYGLLWITAYRLALKSGIPLVLIVHDDINGMYPESRWEGSFLKTLFKKVYLFAKLRFCVSKVMQKYFEQQYGVLGDVLYPMQPKRIDISQTSVAARERGSSLRIAYAGSLNTGEYTRMIIKLSSVLRETGGVCMVYSDYFPKEFMNFDNIIDRGFHPPGELTDLLINEADVLFVPYSFEPVLTYQIAFPSKLADYTYTGKPILLWAPANSAVSKWFDGLVSPIGVQINSVDNMEDLRQAVESFEVPSNIERWSANSLSIGKEFFDNEMQRKYFFEKINELK